MQLQPTRKISLVEQAALQMERFIERGHWSVGEKIPSESTLSQELGISRNTLREAVRALVHTGLLEAKPGDGTYVKATSVLGVALQKRFEEVPRKDVFAARHMLERESARYAAMHRTGEQLQELYKFLRLRRQADKHEDFVAFDFAFHRQVTLASGNVLFVELYDQLANHISKSISETSMGDHPLCHDEHQQLVEAIETKQPDQAVRAVDAYIQQIS
ncbi:FadR/GntR family transcriptional regulator [Aureibacillus halotolerans]|uniref:GntR family transcriptional regulator n=1 Tax=Aureibacillus halotolerans TaxID=1508390 RepID=A0A4R6U8J1_9BACI|nr:FadR/GntR family transcriptional regulator [Aureibacillus halotolerans]TDQ42878.1 GntR family transcriptional regulator [Aureibacillus halotolerans]